MTRLCLASVVVACMAFDSSALAQDDVDELARRHFESATAYYTTGDYDDALREFRRAYEMSHRAALLYSRSPPRRCATQSSRVTRSPSQSCVGR